jgi:hypothetical protein
VTEDAQVIEDGQDQAEDVTDAGSDDTSDQDAAED